MNGYDLSFGNLALSLLITVVAYMVVPVMLRLTKEEAYNKKEANKISIINSVVIAIIFFILREMDGDVDNNTISVAPAFLYYGINLSLLQWNLKPRNYTYLFMIISFISCICGWFISALLFGFVAFIFAFGGLRLSRIKGSWQRIVLYIEAFLGLFIFFSYLHSITLNIGILYVWGFIYALVCMVIFHYTIFKKQVIIVDEIDAIDNDEEIGTTKNLYCKICGGKLNQDKKCKKCGKQYFKFNYKKLSIILGIVIFILIGVCIYIYVLYDKSVELYTDYVVDNVFDESSAQNELDTLNGYRTTAWTKEKLDFFDENIVFVIEGYGDYYYSYDCMVDSIDGDYNYWAYNKEQAIYRGYKKGSCN